MMKTAVFTVRATPAQSARWKQSAEAQGFTSVGAWLAGAADAYLKLRAKAGLPVALSWRSGLFNVALSSGETVRVKGKMAPPFAYYEGTEARVSEGRGKRRYTLVYIPTGRTLATLAQTRDCKALAAELARLWIRSDGSEPDQSEQARALLSSPRP